MTIAMPAFLARLFGFKRVEDTIVVREEESSEVPLRQYLPVQALRSNCSRPVMLVATDLGPTSFTFRTCAPIVQREMMQVEFLLQGVGNVKVNGHVEWVLQAERGGFTGQMLLWTKPEHKKQMRAYMHKQKAGQR